MFAQDSQKLVAFLRGLFHRLVDFTIIHVRCFFFESELFSFIKKIIFCRIFISWKNLFINFLNKFILILDFAFSIKLFLNLLECGRRHAVFNFGINNKRWGFWTFRISQKSWFFFKRHEFFFRARAKGFPGAFKSWRGRRKKFFF